MRSYVTLPLFLIPFLFSCGDATGSLVGGSSLMAMATSTATSGGDGGGGSSGGGTNQTNPDCVPTAAGGTGTHSGNTWTDLYTCYFGMSGTDSCAGTGANCHGDSSSAGSFAWVCGMSSSSCYSGMTGYSMLSIMASQSDPTMSGLYTVLCNEQGSGLMPLGCSPSTEVFQSADFARIAGWVAAGAPNN